MDGVYNLKGLTLVFRGPRRVEVAKGFEAKLELHCGARLLDGFWSDFRISLMNKKEICGRILWLGSNSSAMIVRWVSLKHRGIKQKQVG